MWWGAGTDPSAGVTATAPTDGAGFGPDLTNSAPVHEVSLVSSLLDRVEAEARARHATAVHRIHLKIGELSGVETDLFRSAYEMLRERSLCAGAELEIEAEAARWRCAECGGERESGAGLRCGTCDRPLGLAAGDGIILQRIEMEVA